MSSIDDWRRRSVFALIWLPLVATGCNLLLPVTSIDSLSRGGGLPAGERAQEGIQVEVFFIQRPADDPMLGEGLWGQLDQIGSVEPEVRDVLRANGLRFGISGRNPGYALRSLMRPIAESDSGVRTLRQEYQTPSGVAHEFLTGIRHSEVSLTRVKGDDRETREYGNAQGVFQCRVQSTDGGWVRLELVPQMHFGQLRMRPVATGLSWDLDGRQEVDTFFSQRFQVDLNQGEILVIGREESAHDSVGSCFFREESAEMANEHLLVIRVGAIETVEAVRSASR